MLTENSVKLTNNFYCEKCDYKSCRKNDFNKHLQSKKHNAQNGSKMLIENSLYICNCNKKYKHIQSFALGLPKVEHIFYSLAYNGFDFFSKVWLN